MSTKRLKCLVRRFIDAFNEGKRSGEFDIQQIDKNNYDEYMILLTPKVGIYAGQKHVINMKLKYGSNETYEYPLSPPYLIFTTRIYHANISNLGVICLDILKEPGAWSPAYDFIQIIQSINLLLMEPNTKSPLNVQAAKDYDKCDKKYKLSGSDNKELYFAQYKEIADKFANTDITVCFSLFPQLNNLPHNDIEHAIDLYESLSVEKIAKTPSIKKNRWDKYRQGK